MQSRNRFDFLYAFGAVLLLSCSGVAISAQQQATSSSTNANQESQEPLPDAPSSTERRAQRETDVPIQEQSSTSQPRSGLQKALAPANPNVYVTVLEDTLLRVRTDQPLSTRYSRDGQPVLFTLSEDVIVENMLVIPRGTTIHGEVVGSKRAGTLSGSPELTLQLESLDLGGRSYPLYTYQFRVQGTSKTKPTERKVRGGAVIGAIAGGVLSGSAKGEATAVGKLAGMGTGAALGAGVGALTSAATPGPTVTLPAESQMDFYLASPISVRPMSAEDAARLAKSVRTGEPVLYVRGDTP